ncbi:MAG: L-2-amino-thiazoline-4-carboxylic acid hydrolase [Candidatus Lokiarchaeia archaeon]
MTAFIFFDAYLNTVAEEIGMERALDLLTKMCETMGAIQGKMMKDQSDIKEFDAQTASSLLNSTPGSLGIIGEVIEESPQKAVSRGGRCPIYEAARIMGVDPETLCRKGSMVFMDAVAKQLNPNLSYSCTKFRSSPDDFCEETVILKK